MLFVYARIVYKLSQMLLMMNDTKEKPKEKEMEHCILCGVETHVPLDLHIDYRDYYIEGVGQLCYNCFTNTYK